MGFPPAVVRESTPAEFAAAVAGYARAKGGGGLDEKESDRMFEATMAIRAEEYLAGLTDS